MTPGDLQPSASAAAVKGAYLARLDLSLPHLGGVAAKIHAQAAALSAMPADVDVLCPAGGAILRNGEVVRRFGEGAGWRRVVHYLLFYAWAARQLRALDFAYIRYQGCSPLFLWMLARLRRANPGIVIFVELPTYPYDQESISWRQKLLSSVDRAFRGRMRRHVDRIVTFSSAETIFGIPTVRTRNGVDVAALQPKVRQAQEPGGDLRLMALANLSFWNGYDRVISGLADYYADGGTRNVTLDVVGTGDHLPTLVEQVRKAGLEQRVTFRGALRGPALDEAFSRAHVGVATLAMHRLPRDTTDLKSREFCARALPFLIGYADGDFDPSLPFVFHVPADDSVVDIARLAAGYDQLCERHSGHAAEMRDYAERNLTWHAKMQPVAESLRGLMAQGQRAAS